MSRLQKLLALPAAEFGLLVKAAFLLMAVRLSLWLLPYQLQKRFFWAMDRAFHPSPSARSSSPERIGWSVGVASRVIPRPTCLVQALVAKAMLARAGWPAQLHLGVAKDAHGRFQAHAWVKTQGKVIIGDHEHGAYSSLSSF
jgi:hypothetical protein